jgi:hypothetical protein
LSFRHRSEQYRTSGHVADHFLRQANGRPQVAQIFSGRSDFATVRPLADFMTP